MFIPIVCMSVSSVPVLNCLWSQFPQHLNKVSGIAVGCFALGTVTFNLIFAFIANPDNTKAEITKDGQALFPEEVVNGIFKAVTATFGLAGTFFVVGSFLVSKREGEQGNVLHE